MSQAAGANQVLAVGSVSKKSESRRDTLRTPLGDGCIPSSRTSSHAPTRPVLWAGGAGAMAGPVAAVELAASFLLGSIVNDDPQALALGATVGGPADDGAPELPSSGIAGATEEAIAS
jgi:hypothetical protein